MSKQVLSVEQMQHPQELGLEMKETMLYWCRIHDSRPRAATNNGKWTLCKGKNNPCVAIQHWEYIHAYTLQDVLDKLPRFVTYQYRSYDLIINMEQYTMEYFREADLYTLVKVEFINTNLIDAAYEMLCWCIENGYVKPDNEEECAK